MDQQPIIVSFTSEDGISKVFEFFLTEQFESVYHTTWETKDSPYVRITQEDYRQFQDGNTIEVITGELSETDREIVAHYFNEQMDVFMHRHVKVNVVITSEQEDVPFEYAVITASTFILQNETFVKKLSFTSLMNNRNGYCQVEYFVDKDADDRYIKVEQIEIGAKTPKAGDADQKYYKGEVFYLEHEREGKVRAISADKYMPSIDIKVSFLRELFAGDIEFNGEVFQGTITEYIP